jgi:hypothetical protein
MGLAALKKRPKSTKASTLERTLVTSLSFRTLERRWVVDQESPWFGCHRPLPPPPPQQPRYWPETAPLTDDCAWMCAYERWKAARQVLQPIMRLDCDDENVREAARYQQMQAKAYFEMRRIALQHSPPLPPYAVHFPAPIPSLPSCTSLPSPRSSGAKTSPLRHLPAA